MLHVRPCNYFYPFDVTRTNINLILNNNKDQLFVLLNSDACRSISVTPFIHTQHGHLLAIKFN